MESNPVPPAEDRRWNEAVLAQSKAKRQHYVARLYLQRFGRDGLIPTRDITKDREFVASTTNLAVESGYNDFDVGDVALSTEDWLANVESNAAPIIARLIEQPREIRTLSEPDEIHLARYLMAQKFRGPRFRESDRINRTQLIDQMKDIARSVADKVGGKEMWDYWEKQPDEWWLHEETPYQASETAAYMLSETLGWANLLRPADWRVGSVPRPLYTCDNPLAEYVPPVRPWWARGAAIWEQGYVFALSPSVLLWINPLGYEVEVEPKGRRWHRPFTDWETMLALHIITKNATRFLFGDGPYVSPECANSCLKKIDAARISDAMRLQGYDPRPPRTPELDAALTSPPAPQ